MEQIGLECNSYKELGAGPVTVLPLYASLPPDQQRRVFSEVPGRKIDFLGKSNDLIHCIVVVSFQSILGTLNTNVQLKTITTSTMTTPTQDQLDIKEWSFSPDDRQRRKERIQQRLQHRSANPFYGLAHTSDFQIVENVIAPLNSGFPSFSNDARLCPVDVNNDALVDLLVVEKKSGGAINYFQNTGFFRSIIPFFH